MDELTQEFRGEIESFLETYALRKSTFGLAAVGDHKLVNRLREEKTVTGKTMSAARVFMRGYIKAHKAGKLDAFWEDVKRRREERLKTSVRRRKRVSEDGNTDGGEASSSAH